MYGYYLNGNVSDKQYNHSEFHKLALLQDGEVRITTNNYLPERERVSVRIAVIEKGFTEVPSDEFANCTNLEKVILPDTVRVIRSHAFFGCKSLSYDPGNVLLMFRRWRKRQNMRHHTCLRSQAMR